MNLEAHFEMQNFYCPAHGFFRCIVISSLKSIVIARRTLDPIPLTSTARFAPYIATGNFGSLANCWFHFLKTLMTVPRLFPDQLK